MTFHYFIIFSEERGPKGSTFTSPLDHEDFGSRSNSRLSSVTKFMDLYAQTNNKSDTSRSVSGIPIDTEEEGERTPRNQPEIIVRQVLALKGSEAERSLASD